MKVTTYHTVRNGGACTIYAGPLADFDLQGGLEEMLLAELECGVAELRILLGGMKFLHATLTAGLLNVQIHAERRGARVVLVDTPEFVRMMMKRWAVDDRFSFTSSADCGISHAPTAVEAGRIAEEVCGELSAEREHTGW